MSKDELEETQSFSQVGRKRGSTLIEGLDYYIDAKTGFFVLTAHYLREQGQCCGKGCRHCPYIPPHSGSPLAKLPGNRN